MLIEFIYRVDRQTIFILPRAIDEPIGDNKVKINLLGVTEDRTKRPQLQQRINLKILRHQWRSNEEPRPNDKNSRRLEISGR